MIWKLHPESRVSIDGRFRTVYPEEVLKDHFDALKSNRKWREVLVKYSPDIILVKRHSFSLKMIADPGKWVYVYSDPTSIVFVKDDISQQAILKRLNLKALFYPKEELSIYFP